MISHRAMVEGLIFACPHPVSEKTIADNLAIDIEEVRQLQLDYPELTARHNSMRMVGYSQAWNFLVDNLTELEMVEQGKAATRQLAKRQITWLRSMECVAIDDPQLDTSKLLAEATKLIEQWMHIKS